MTPDSNALLKYHPNILTGQSETNIFATANGPSVLFLASLDTIEVMFVSEYVSDC